MEQVNLVQNNPLFDNFFKTILANNRKSIFYRINVFRTKEADNQC